MNSLDAAETVLREAGGPLHYREITERILAQRLWATRGKTPWSTVAARLVTDMKLHGQASRFIRTGPGMYSLNPSAVATSSSDPIMPSSEEPQAGEHEDRGAPSGGRPRASDTDDGAPSPAPPQATDADESNDSSALSSAQPQASDTDGGAPSPAPPQASDATETMSFVDAADRVLSDSGDREPMHYRAITDLALQHGLITTKGRTPEMSMYAGILTEIRRLEANGEQPRFVQHGRGMVGLAGRSPVGVAALVERQNREVRQVLLDRAREDTPAEFESLVGELLVAMGFTDVEVTNISGDGGIDVRGILVVGDAVQIRMAVQAKRWKSNVQAPEVQRVRGSLGAHEQGLIITTSGFSKGAKTEATRADAAPVALINGKKLAELLAEHEIGARKKPYELFILDEGDNRGE